MYILAIIDDSGLHDAADLSAAEPCSGSHSHTELEEVSPFRCRHNLPSPKMSPYQQHECKRELALTALGSSPKSRQLNPIVLKGKG